MMDQKKIGVRVQEHRKKTAYDSRTTGGTGEYLARIFACNRIRSKGYVPDYAFQSGSNTSDLYRLSLIRFIFRRKIYGYHTGASILLK